MQYSPKLKKAMEEIKEILQKHDIAATVTLHTEGHAEYLNHITPSYSCAKMDEQTGRFELRARKIHYSNEAERQNKLMATANMLSLLSEVTAKNATYLTRASRLVDKILQAEHFDSGHSSHTQQNN